MNRGQVIVIARRMLRQDFVLPRERDEVARAYLRAVGADGCDEERREKFKRTLRANRLPDQQWHEEIGCYCEAMNLGPDS